MAKFLCTLAPLEYRLKRALELQIGAMRMGALNPDLQVLNRARLRLVALYSCGKDSTALLHATARVVRSKHFRWKDAVDLMALHFDHGTRNGVSARDAEFAVKTCRQIGVPLVFVRREAPWCAKDPFQQQASNWRRHECRRFAAKWSEGGPSLFLSAHHREDLAETLLMNITRGSGLSGLQGISITQDSPPLFRPFLRESLADILNYLKNGQMNWREDSTNQTNDYTRNRIRHLILPELRKLNPKIDQALMRLSEEAVQLETERSLETEHGPPETSSVHELGYSIWKNYPQYRRHLTASQVQNLHQHYSRFTLQSVKARTGTTIFVPLRQGWQAKLSHEKIVLVPPEDGCGAEDIGSAREEAGR